jgi:hypothetical protein
MTAGEQELVLKLRLQESRGPGTTININRTAGEQELQDSRRTGTTGQQENRNYRATGERVPQDRRKIGS